MGSNKKKFFGKKLILFKKLRIYLTRKDLLKMIINFYWTVDKKT